MISQDFKSEIGERFKLLANLIMNRGLAGSLTDIGKLMGASTQAVSQIVKGERLATLEQINTLAKATNFNPSWLLMGTEPIFLEEPDHEEDIIVMVTTAMNNSQIPLAKGEQIIKYIREVQNGLDEKDTEIMKLNDEIIALLRVVKKLG